MAGHSHSANIARRKGAVDAKRSKVFSKMARGIMVTARQGGGDPEMNLALRYAIDRAKAVSLPKDTIERAIKKGTGELGGGDLDACVYEAVGPGGTFILVEALTDNRNRTAPEIRKILERRNASQGNCAWAFERKGVIVVKAEGVSEENLMDLVLEAGAEDLQSSGEFFEITTEPADLEAVRAALTDKGIPIEDASISQVPKTTVAVDEETGRKLLDLLNDLDDQDDVQEVYSNIDFPDQLLAEET